jgi:hypothetical protein
MYNKRKIRILTEFWFFDILNDFQKINHSIICVQKKSECKSFDCQLLIEQVRKHPFN